MFAVAAILMIAGSLFGQFAGGVGRAMIVQDLATTDPQVEDVLWTLLVQFDLAPVGWAFALASSPVCSRSPKTAARHGRTRLMTTTNTTTRATRSETADAITVFLYAAAALVTVAFATIMRVARTFRETGSPGDPVRPAADLGDDRLGRHLDRGVRRRGDDHRERRGHRVDRRSIVAAIALWALAALLVIASVTLVAWNFCAAGSSSAANVWAFNAIGWTLVAAPILIVMLETMGRNGVTSAHGLGDGEPVHLVEFWTIAPFFATGVTVGLVAVAFRRGIRLQHEKIALEKETEGLV